MLSKARESLRRRKRTNWESPLKNISKIPKTSAKDKKGQIGTDESKSGRPPFDPPPPGRFGNFFVLCFLALGGHCLQMLCLPGFSTHANTQNLPYFRAFPADIWEHSPPKFLFSRQTLNCQIVPALPSYTPPLGCNKHGVV